MPKITLSTIGSRYGSIDALNANFDAIEEAFENTVSRDGTGPNFLTASLDANSNRIINLPIPVSGHEAATKNYVDGVTAILTPYLEDIATVATNIDAVVAAGNGIDDIVANSANIATVANNITNVNNVGSNIGNVNTVASITSELQGNVDSIVAVSSSLNEIEVVSQNIGNVSLVGLELTGSFQEGVIYDFGSIDDVPVGPAEPSTSSIIIVATNIDDVRDVGDNIVDVTTVAGVIGNVSTVAAIDTEVTAVALIASNVTIVANNDTNITTVATSIADVNTVAANIVDVQNAEENAQDAVNAKTAAEAAQGAAEAVLEDFDIRYLGTKTTDPTVDNNGDPLVAGTLYFNISDGVMKVYDGTVWLAAYASLSGALAVDNNLSDLADAAAARTNLGLGSAATTSSTDYATSTQGSNADTAFGWGDHALAGYLTSIPNGSVTSEKLAATLDYGSIA